MPGTLYIVSTPIGNLEDITLRAIATLKSVDRIACEDTRQTGKLLQRYEIRKPLISFHDHNERARIPSLIHSMINGDNIALVSDGGTPLINDPGWRLVHETIKEKINVTWIPGAVALIGALALSGLPIDKFVFEGFLPAKKVARQKRLKALKNIQRTVVLYESPHRLLATLQDIHQELGDLNIACARELTKMYEETCRDKVSVLVAYFKKHKPRGEFVIVIDLAKRIKK